MHTIGADQSFTEPKDAPPIAVTRSMSNTRVAALLGLVESDEEEVDVLADDSVAITTTKMAPARKPRAAAANRVTKSNQNATRQTNGRTTTITNAAARKVLADKSANVSDKPTRGKGNKRPATEDIAPAVEEEQDESSMASDAKPKAGRGRPRATKVPKLSNEEDIPTADEPEPKPEPATRPAAKRGRKPKPKVEAAPTELEIPETQPVEEEIPETQAPETTELSVEEYDQVEDLPPHPRPGSSSVQRHQSHSVFGASRRTVPASDSEIHEPSMRRRVGELNRKYESLEAKYRDLREIGVKEAERNYDRLKKQSEEKANSK